MAVKPPGTDSVLTDYVGPPFPEAMDPNAWDHDLAGNTGLPGDSGISVFGDTAVHVGSGRPKPPTAGPRLEGVQTLPRPKDWPDKIHVLLSKGTRSLAFYSLGDLQILAEEGPTDGHAQGKGTGASLLTTLRGRFDLKKAGSGFEINVHGKTLKTTSARGLRLVSVNPYNLLDLGGSVYRGGMHVLADSDGGVSAVNVLGVEDYLRGVLPYELGHVDREALEALKAQAIVARTYAYKRMLHPGGRDFHVFSDVQDQVYKGVKGEYLLSDRAVWETRGVVVTYKDSLAECYYFSTCGGRTASKHEVWGGEPIPYLVSRPDTDLVGEPFCQASKYSQWQEQWNLPQLSGILKRNLKSAGVTDAPNFSKVTGLQIASHASCGRARIMKITEDKGQIQVKGDKVRWALRPAGKEEKILPSAWFDLKVDGNQVTAQGRGFGHGIGLCQFGAIARARSNQDYHQIIDAYYSGVQLVEYR